MAGSPAGIAQGQQAPLRAAAAGDVAQDIEAGGEPDAIADHHGAVVAIVGRMEHETATGLDRSAEMDADIATSFRPVDAELGQQIGEGQRPHQAIHHQSHGAVGAMGADENHAAGKARISHGRHRDQQLAQQIAVVQFFRHRTHLGRESRADKSEYYTHS